jgi:hypothetical protein
MACGAGVVNAAGLCMLNLAPKEVEAEWEHEEIFAGRLPGTLLRSAHSSKGGYGILLSCSPKTQLRWVVGELWVGPVLDD